MFSPIGQRSRGTRESNENVHSRSSSLATRTSPSPSGRSRGGDTSSAQHTEPSSLPAVREKLAGMGLQTDTINVILASWRNSTSKQYNSYLLRWKAFCDQKQITSENAGVLEGLAFLTQLHNQNLGYSAINTARSALSSILTLQENRTFGEHPLVTRFLKGIFELKPSLPPYSFVWDVGVVLRYFQSTDYPQAMNLEGLTKKLTTLLALITAQRCQTLVKLDLDNMQELPDRIVFIYVINLRRLDQESTSHLSKFYPTRLMENYAQLHIFGSIFLKLKHYDNISSYL